MKLFIDMVRTKKGISMQALAEKSGVARSYVQRLEADAEVNPSLKVMCKLARALEVEITELFSYDE